MADWGGIVSLLLSGASGLVENLIGQDMSKEAEKKRAALGEPPKFEIPQSQLDHEKLMRTRARQEMPGAAQMRAGIEAQTGQAAGAASMAAGSQVGALAGSNLAQSNRRRQLRQLGIAGQVYSDRAQMGNIQATASRAPYEQMQFEYNEWLPWQIAKNEIASIRGVGQQQLVGGLDRLAATGIQGANMYAQNQYYNQQMPYGGGSYSAAPSYSFTPEFQAGMSNMQQSQQAQWRNPYTTF
jgi:hypothetical protein